MSDATPHPRGIKISLLSDTRYLGAIRAVIRETAMLSGLADEETAEIELAVTEALANVIRHCYGNCSDKQMDITLVAVDHELEIQIDDYGKFIDPVHMKGRELEDVKPGGLGVHLMKKVMDEVTYKKNSWGGTRLTMRKRAAQPDQKEKPA